MSRKHPQGPCCTKKNMQPWDCGCSWGCHLCDRHLRCKKCGRLFQGEHNLGDQRQTESALRGERGK